MMSPLPSTTNKSTSLLPQDPISIHTIEYDFEDYALKHGIPETLDPLPYRKAGSVFSSLPGGGGEGESGDATNNNSGGDDQYHQQDQQQQQQQQQQYDQEAVVLTSAKNDPRLRTVVCRHWLRDLCMKGSACEFLHQYDLSKMPLCRHGDRCKIKDCPFRHISEANRLECVFYSQGFCIHGPFCRYKHLRRDRQDLPLVADFTLGLSQMQASANKGGDGGPAVSRRPAPKPNEFYKISLCKHFMQGDCPFGDGCHFAHGEHELRSFPKKATPGLPEEESDGTELHDSIFTNSHANTNFDYFYGGAAGGGKPSPILEPENANFFILQAATQTDLAVSTVHCEWWVQPKHATMLNDAFRKTVDNNNGKDSSSSQVMLFFTVSDSRHLQGAALMTSEAVYEVDALREDILADVPPDQQFSYRFSLEWYRTTEFPISMALEAAPDLFLPSNKTQLCQDMSSQTGESLMKALWNSPLVALYEAWSVDDDEDGNEPLEPPAPENILTDFRCPPPGEVAWPVLPGPGFIFGCSSDTMDECLGRGIFGMPAHMKAAAQWIVPGSSVFLFNVTDRLLFGIFEALTPAAVNIEPTAFSKNPKATTSPFPIQVRVRVSLECPPLEDNDPVLNDILRSRGNSGRIGSLTFAQTEAIASLLASQCGALQYMMDYQQGVWEGDEVNPPPIALPPRKIKERVSSNSSNHADEQTMAI